MPRSTGRRLVSLLVLFALFLIDWQTKQWASQRDLVVLNQGGVFGLLPGGGWMLVSLLWLWLLYEWWKVKDSWLAFGLGLLVVGGVGNLVDRVLFGAVRDFIYYPYVSLYGNVADIYLVLGVVWLLGVRVVGKRYNYDDLSNSKI